MSPPKDNAKIRAETLVNNIIRDLGAFPPTQEVREHIIRMVRNFGIYERSLARKRLWKKLYDEGRIY